MKEMVTIGKVAATEQERLAFEIINLREKAEQGKKPDDYLKDAATCTAKAIINIIVDDVDEYCVECGCTDQETEIKLRLIRHEECVGDNIYRCWYDVVWQTADGAIPKTVIDLKTRFGHIFEYASTYFSEDLVQEVVQAISGILGESEEEKTKSAKMHLWKYKVS